MTYYEMRMRTLWNISGFMLLALGMFGVVTPGVPGTGFLVVALFCFTKGGNEKLRNWMLNHPRFGKVLRDWEREQSLPLWVKWVACSCIVVFSAYGIYAVPVMWVKGVLLALAAIGVWYVGTRKVSGRGELNLNEAEALDLAS